MKIKRYVEKAFLLVFALTMFLGVAKVNLKAETVKLKSVFSIDAGRKYFSEAELKDLIDKAKNNNFTDIQLILGNDGLRFLLDDMEITVNGKTYESNAVRDALINGTKAYYDDHNGTHLNETMMNSILDYAKEKGVKVIPTINSPGHMDAILNGMEILGIQNTKFTYNGKTSKTTVDLANKEAVSFTKALVSKYVDYFSNKVEIFNFGGDEYANDATYHNGSVAGWKVLKDRGLYDDFVVYANDLAKIIKDKGMKPMSFNDGIYYNSDVSEGVFDKDIIVSYWTPGFENYTPAPAALLAEKGHKILNTNDAWYYVIGRNYNGSGWYNFDQAINGMNDAKFNQIAGVKDAGSIDIIGSMVCAWSDMPSRTYDSSYADKMMKNFALKNSDFIYEGDTKPEIKIERKRVVLSIDAGRKYYSADLIKQLIKKAHDTGYTDLQLILGNDGLRFNLDDMSVLTYSSDDVKAALKKGNDEYYADPNGNAISESEMKDILAYAKTNDIKIIPVINSPGHMDAILVAMRELGINNPQVSTSKRTVDLNNNEAISFTKALISKYVEFFKDDADIFNIGCDEYANDVSGYGWSKLLNNGSYGLFVDYVNDLSKIIKDAGMKPMSFNDGIYYNNSTRYGIFDKDLIISYWTAGWWGFNVAKPDFLVQKGHKIFNTNDGWYYVLGDINASYSYAKIIERLPKINFNDVPARSNMDGILGSVQAIWADNPKMDYNMDKVFDLMDKYSTRYRAEMPLPKVTKADYTKLDEELALIPEDLSDYSEDSLKVLDEAKKTIVRDLNGDEQSKVDAMVKAIHDALVNLKLRIADYSKLDNVLKTVPEDLSKYTPDTIDSLNKAKNRIKRDLTFNKQAEVDKTAKDLDDAIKSLKFKRADQSKLQQVITSLPKNLELYTKETADVVARLLDKAPAYNVDINSQQIIDNLVVELTKAINNLEYKDADYSKVNDELALIPLNKEDYKTETIKALDDAIQEVVKGLEITKQDDVDKMAKSIRDARLGLKLKDADYKALDEALKRIPADLSKYTKESIDALRKAEKAVIKGLDFSKQKEVNSMTNAIDDAIFNLKLKKDKDTINAASPNTSDNTNINILGLYALCSGGAMVYLLRKSRAK